MQPFINPQYLSQYQQYKPSYQQPQLYQQNQLFPQGMQYQQPIQPQPQVGGKVVDSIDVVRATDVPMDGNLYYFPKADGTEIYTKNWNTDGTTRILTYKPCIENEATNLPSQQEKAQIDAISALTARFEERFDKLEKMLAKPTTSKAKKESESE